MKIFHRGMPLKGFPFFLSFLLLLQVHSYAQNIEAGLGLGAASYTGDLNPTYDVLSNRPAGTAFFRYFLSDYIAVKGSLVLGNIAASDRPNPTDPFANRRNADFSILFVEAGGVLEYYFLNFRDEKLRQPWSPYFFGGVAIFTMAGHDNVGYNYSNSQPVIPFGAGVRYTIDQRWSVGFEFGARLTFFDYVDNVSQRLTQNKSYQYGNRHDNDWYYYTGFTLSYTFYTIPCPFEYK